MLGACLGFLPHNFHPARIFMGDAGALLLGLLMAAATIAVGGHTDDAVLAARPFFFFAPLFIPLVILGVPIVDTAFSIVRRAAPRHGRRPWPTRTTCTTGSCASATASAAACSSSGRGRRCCRRSCSYPTYTDGEGDALVPLAIAALAPASSTRCSTPGRAGARDGRRERRPATPADRRRRRRCEAASRR